MAKTYPNGVVSPEPGDLIPANGAGAWDMVASSTDAQLANRSLLGHTHAWATITGRPVVFPPAAHDHDGRYYTEAEADQKLGGKVDATDPRLSDARTPSAHTHALTDVTGLAARLAALEYDSGWCDVSADLYNGAVGTLHVRRIGTSLHWRLNGLTNTESHVFYIPPPGMTSPQPGLMYPVQSTDSTSRVYLNTAGQMSRTRTATPIPAGSWTAGSYAIAPGTVPPATPPGIAV